MKHEYCNGTYLAKSGSVVCNFTFKDEKRMMNLKATFNVKQVPKQPVLHSQIMFNKKRYLRLDGWVDAWMGG